MDKQTQNESEITFIVPCYNYGRYLAECLDSIFSQEGNWNIEVLVIDDSSSDNSWEIIQSYGAKLKAIRHATNKGHCETLTEGLRMARGSYVSRIDPDDRLRREFLATTVPILRNHPEVGLVYGDVALIDENGTQTAASCDQVHGGRDFKGNEFVKLMKENFICAPTVLARRTAWLEALPIPDKLAFNDWHFTTMIARRHELYYVHKVIADYRVHAANLHKTIAQSGDEEISVLRVLDRYFNETELIASLETEKRRERGRIYSSHYAAFARKYFGAGQFANARRCYLKAARYRPSVLLSTAHMRYFAGSLLGPRLYERVKRIAGASARP